VLEYNNVPAHAAVTHRAGCARACVRPEHLALRLPHDRERKNRHRPPYEPRPRRPRAPRPIAPEWAALAAAQAAGVPVRELAREHGITPSAAYQRIARARRAARAA
jgi:hypothetical protein